MKCTLCGFLFDEKNAKTACVKYCITKGCGLIKCPSCGFEQAPEPKWIRWLRKFNF